MKTQTAPSTPKPQLPHSPRRQSAQTSRPKKAASRLLRRNPQPPAPRYALHRDLGFWRLTFEGRHAVLKHELGLAYVAYLLTNPPAEPIHGLRLALEVRALYGKGADAADLIQQ